MSAKTHHKPGRKMHATGQYSIVGSRGSKSAGVVKQDYSTGAFTVHDGPREQARLVKAGLPAGAFTDLADRLGSTQEALSRLTNIPTRTLARRLKDGIFQQDEGERVLRVERVLQAALRLFEGNPDRARRWLNSPDDLFDGATPLEFSDTEPGALFVLDVIGRLEHGVFS